MDYAVTVFPKENKGNMKASAVLSFGQNDFVVTNIKILEGKNGLYIAFPSVKEQGVDENGNFKYHEIAFPTTAEFRKELEQAVMSAYNDPKHVYYSSKGNLKEAPETECRVYPTEGHGKFRGFASIQFNNCFIVKDIRVVAKDGGKPFFYYPSFTYTKDGKEMVKEYAAPKSKTFGRKLYVEMSKIFEKAIDSKTLESSVDNDAFGLNDDLPFEISNENTNDTKAEKKRTSIDR